MNNESVLQHRNQAIQHCIMEIQRCIMEIQRCSSSAIRQFGTVAKLMSSDIELAYSRQYGKAAIMRQFLRYQKTHGLLPHQYWTAVHGSSKGYTPPRYCKNRGL